MWNGGGGGRDIGPVRNGSRAGETIPWLGGSQPVREATGRHPSGQRVAPTNSRERLKVRLFPSGRRKQGPDNLGFRETEDHA